MLAAERAQAAAEAGQILATRAVRDCASKLATQDEGRDYALKGYAKPVAPDVV